MLRWAWVQCGVQGVSAQSFLQQLLQTGIRPRQLRRRTDELRFFCPAKQYRVVAAIAHKAHGRSRILKKKGLYFRFRRVWKRSGLWLGCAVMGICILYSQQYIWHIDFDGMDLVQRELAEAVLRQEGIGEGVRSTEALLERGETALVKEQIGFGWASLNFEKGRLLIETAPADPVPPIYTADTKELRAKAAATIEKIVVENGTPLVNVGDSVQAGDVLIAPAREDRKGNPVPGLASGRVTGCLIWETSCEQPLYYEAQQIAGPLQSRWALSLGGHTFAQKAKQDSGYVLTQHEPLTFMGMPLPGMRTEEITVPVETCTGMLTETLAQAKAKEQCLTRLYQQWGDATICEEQESYRVENDVMYCQYKARIVTDLCTK